ncbi:quinate dehydrogenase [Thelonectria olida]|uniref:Quinate dehydrogenase n=1 Tax=Thelonectria olida TaxID=1576542 RepID=A0A9P9AIS2_9HYPO|nr:quinate dehydrogenase [Thelonectria olida]
MFGYDSAFIGGTLTLPAFKSRFGPADASGNTAASLSAIIVSTFQAGCFFGAILVYYFTEKLGRRIPLMECGAIFDLGAILQVPSSGKRSHLRRSRSACSKFLPALKEPDIVGCAVTMPFKVSIMSSLDDVTEEGRVMGAINTVFLRRAADGSTRHIGTNTDCIGVREAFLQNFPEVSTKALGKPALVIGGGGACRAAVFALWKWLGASFGGELVHVASIEQAAALEAPVLVVGTVPNFPPKEEGYILEMCYHPKTRTEFFNLDEEAGWKMLYNTKSMI